MRVSRRILALALALLMIVGLMTSASANLNNASDNADIAPEYRVAVGVLYTLGLLEGFDDGTFRPETTVRRSEMAKLVFEMVNGPGVQAPNLATQFPDVTPGSGAYWARGYIAWAHGQGIVVGYPDGLFRPNQAVTIVEAATMLLRALGYGRMGEYEGAGWAQRASNDALARGIFNADIVDGFDVTDGAERQVAAQMVFNTMFINRVTFVSGQDIYVPNGAINPANRFFGWAWDLPVLMSDLAAPANDVPVILANWGGLFIELDGVTVALDVAYSPSHREVGRVVDVYAAVGQRTLVERAYFLDILSTDVPVAAGATDDARRLALDITNANTASDQRGQSIMTFWNYLLSNNRVNVAPLTGALSSATLNPLELQMIAAAPTTWVLFDDADVAYDGFEKFRTVIYTTRSVEDVMIYGGNAWFGNGREVAPGVNNTPWSVPLSMVRFEDGLTAADFSGTDATEWDAYADPALRGRWANLEIGIRDGQLRFILTEVETITGIVDFRRLGPNLGDTAFRFAGSTRTLNYVQTPQNRQDAADFSDRLWSLDNINAPFRAFINAPLPAPGDNTTVWTAYISGVTGNVISVEQWTPDLTNAELVMVFETAWDYTNQVGEASFVRAVEGVPTTVRDVVSFPVGGGGGAAMDALRGNVAWAVEIDGVWFLWGPFGNVADGGIGFDSLTPPGQQYAEWGVIDLRSTSNEALFGNVFTLGTQSRWILDNGTFGGFPAPTNPMVQNPLPFRYLIWTLDAAQDNIVTVFVVRNLAPAVNFALNTTGNLTQNGTVVAPTSGPDANGVYTWTVTLPVGSSLGTVPAGWTATTTGTVATGLQVTITSPAQAITLTPTNFDYSLATGGVAGAAAAVGDTITFAVATTGFFPDGTSLTVSIAGPDTDLSVATPITTTAGAATAVVTVDVLPTLANVYTVTVSNGVVAADGTATVTVVA